MLPLILAARTLWGKRWVIAATVTVSTIGAFGASYLVAPTFEARVTFLPIGDEGTAVVPNELTSLINSAGVSTTDNSFSTILAYTESRTLRERVARRLNLNDRLFETSPSAQSAMNQAVFWLGENTTTAQDPRTNVISITVEAEDPRLAREIVDATVLELNTLLAENAASFAKTRTETLRKMVEEQNGEIAALQVRLAEYQRQHMLVLPENQIASALDYYNDLRKRRLDTEIALAQAIEIATFTDSNVTLLRLQQDILNDRIKEMETESIMGGSISLLRAPDILVEYSNIRTELDSVRNLHAALLAAYDRSRMQPSGDPLEVFVLDPAIEPMRPSSPNRIMLAAVAFAVSLFATIALFLFADLVNRELASQNGRR